MGEYSDRQINVATLTDILIKCKTYDVRLRKNDTEILNEVINMHNPVYVTAKRKSRARDCAECIFRIFRVCVNLDGRARKDLKALVSYIAYLSQDKAMSASDSEKLERKMDQIFARYRAAEDKALNDNGTKNTSALAHNVRTVLRYIDENIALLDICANEKRAQDDVVIKQRITDTKKYFEGLRARVAKAEALDGIYSPSVTPYLDKIVKLVVQSRGDIYSGKFLANLSHNAEESVFARIDREIEGIESLRRPSGKVRQSYLDHMHYQIDKEYQTYVDYPRKKAEYEEAKLNVQNEIERLYEVVERSAEAPERLEEEKNEIQQKIVRLKKQKENGEINAVTYQIKAKLLKSQWENCISVGAIRQSNTLVYMQSILTNLKTCNDAFNSIDTFIEHASMTDFMDFIDRILKSIYSILAVLKTNNPNDGDVQKIRDAIEDLTGLQQESAYKAVVAGDKIHEVMADMLDDSILNVNDDPLADIDFDTNTIQNTDTNAENDLEAELTNKIKKPTNTDRG